ncbi:MAG: hypothetical protein EBW36_05115, partial [Actinobacteria bacterium]|nr:hypothetical protein [Actinomycetota bacterium]
APALVYLSAWFLLGTISQKPLVRIMPALVLALSPLVMELQHRGGVVELTALVSAMLTARLLVSSANAFSPARSWRWVALAGLTGAVLAISSPLLFLLALLGSVVLIAMRPSRSLALVWFSLPGLSLLLPWLVAAAEIDIQLGLVTSSARLQPLPLETASLALLGLTAIAAALAIVFARTWLAAGVWVLAGVVVIGQSLLPISGLAELPAVLLILGLIATADLASKITGKLAASLATIAAIGVGAFSGYVNGFASQPDVSAVQDRQLPALVVAFADVDQMTRTLKLEVSESIQAELVWGDGISQDEANLLYERTLPESQLSVTLAQLAGSLVAGNSAGVEELMQATSVDFILLAPTTHPARAEAEVSLSTLALLQSSGESEFGVLYRLDELQASSSDLSISGFVNIQLALLASYLLLAIPTPATIRGGAQSMKFLARALLALLLPALVVSGYVFLPAAQAPSQEVAASEFQVSVDPADLEIVCAGALIEVGGEDGTELDLIERVGEAGVKALSVEEISVPPTTVGSIPIEVKGSEQSTELLSAIQTQAVSRERASGLAASYCEQPITSGWFISGASGVGNES